MVRIAIPVLRTPSLEGRILEPTFQLDYSLTAKTTDTTNTVEDVATRNVAVIKVPTEVDHNSAILFSEGPYENEGLIQVQADADNTYTIVWNVTNTTSDIQNVSLTGLLPIYVDFIEGQSSDGSSFSYDPVEKRVTWNIDQVPGGSGSSRRAPESSFKVRLSPAQSQSGQVLDLVRSKQLRAQEAFTNQAVEINDLSDDTTAGLRADPQFRNGVDEVQ